MNKEKDTHLRWTDCMHKSLCLRGSTGLGRRFPERHGPRMPFHGLLPSPASLTLNNNDRLLTLGPRRSSTRDMRCNAQRTQGPVAAWSGHGAWLDSRAALGAQQLPLLLVSCRRHWRSGRTGTRRWLSNDTVHVLHRCQCSLPPGPLCSLPWLLLVPSTVCTRSDNDWGLCAESGHPWIRGVTGSLATPWWLKGETSDPDC